MEFGTITILEISNWKQQQHNKCQPIYSTYVDPSDKFVGQICFKPKHIALECRSNFDHSYQSREIPLAPASMHINDKEDGLIFYSDCD